MEIDEDPLEQVEHFKYLGVVINENLTWSDHIDSIQTKVAKRLGILKRIRHLIPRKSREIVFNTLILPILDYGDIVWGDRFNNTLMDHLQVLQNRGAKLILDRSKFSSSSDAIKCLNKWKPLRERRKFHRSSFVFKCFKNDIDFNFNTIYRYEVHSYDTRNKKKIFLPFYNTNWGQSKSNYLFMNEWNDLPETLRLSSSFAIFKCKYWLHMNNF